MAAARDEHRHLRALIDEERPGESVREICVAAGVSESRLGYWLRPSTDSSRMPTMTQIHDLARIIRCESGQVYRAIRADVDGTLTLHDELSEDERALVAAYRGLDGGEQERVLQAMELPVDQRTLLAIYRRLNDAHRRQLLQIALVFDTDG